MSRKIRVAVVGVGHFGRYHVEKYARLQDVELVGVADCNAGRAGAVAGEFGTKAHGNYRALIGEVDAVSIAVPTFAHHEVVSEFLDAGVDVLVEKPIAITVEEADRMIALARAKGRILQVGHLERFNAALIALERVITEPLFIESHRLGPFSRRGTDVDVILDLMIHDLDIIRNLVRSDISEIDAIGVPVLSENVDIANARLQFESGCIANVTSSRVSFDTVRKIRIFQPDAYISIDFQSQKIAIFRRVAAPKPGAVPEISIENLELSKHDSLEEEINAFLQTVRTRGVPRVTGEDGRLALAVAHRIVKLMKERLEDFSRTAKPSRPRA